MITGVTSPGAPVPVTAKLSRKFYDQLGDGIATELVDWFNAVDTEYQRQYREANDLNWERFKAFSRADMAEFRQSVNASIAALRAEMEAGFAAMRGEHRDSIASLRIEMATLRADMMKWMFIYWTGSIITIGGLMFGLLRMQH